MSIVLPVLADSDLDSYDGLLNVLERWLDGAEAAVSYPGEMISLAEAYLRRLILHHDREGTTTLSTTTGTLTLPSDFLQARSAYLTTDPLQVMAQVSPDALRLHWSAARTGQPKEYALQAGSMILGPSPDTTYSLVLVYQRSLSPLSATVQSNWLLESHPDAYLYGAMMHAEIYAGNDGRAEVIKGALDQIIADVNAEGNRKRYGGPIRMMSGIQE